VRRDGVTSGPKFVVKFSSHKFGGAWPKTAYRYSPPIIIMSDKKARDGYHVSRDRFRR
jgi:hypothetical protein